MKYTNPHFVFLGMSLKYVISHLCQRKEVQVKDFHVSSYQKTPRCRFVRAYTKMNLHRNLHI